jgi:hypothetical protein
MTTLATAVVRDLGWAPQRRYGGVSAVFRDASALLSCPRRACREKGFPRNSRPLVHCRGDQATMFGESAAWRPEELPAEARHC